jgi:hypothetical protein
MSEWYLRDTSRKIKAVMKAKGERGERLTTEVIYGYRYDKDKQWIIDPEAAEVVRRIFRLTIEGKGPCEIARIFADEKIERPSYYMTTREFPIALNTTAHPVCMERKHGCPPDRKAGVLGTYGQLSQL